MDPPSGDPLASFPSLAHAFRNEVIWRDDLWTMLLLTHFTSALQDA